MFQICFLGFGDLLSLGWIVNELCVLKTLLLPSMREEQCFLSLKLNTAAASQFSGQQIRAVMGLLQDEVIQRVEESPAHSA